MAVPFQGIKYPNVLNERFVEILIGDPSKQFSSTGSTSTFNPGLRTPATINRKQMTEEDVLGRDIPQKSILEIDINSLQTDVPAVNNAYLLGKASTGFCQVRLKEEQGNYYNFVDSATSSLLSLAWAFEVDEKKRNLGLKFHSNLEPSEWEGVVTSATGGASVGGFTSTGTITPVTLVSSPAYDRTKHFSPGFKSITLDSVNIGVFEGAKLKLENLFYGKDNKDRGLNTHLKVTGEVIVNRSTANDILGSTQTGEYLEKNSIWTDYAGNTWTFAAGSVSFNGDVTKADRRGMVKLTVKGIFVNNVDEASPLSVVFTATDITFNRIGY